MNTSGDYYFNLEIDLEMVHGMSGSPAVCDVCEPSLMSVPMGFSD